MDKSPLKPKNISPSKEKDSPVKAPARKRARIIESDDEDENNVDAGAGDCEKKTAQRLEKVCEEKNSAVKNVSFTIMIKNVGKEVPDQTVHVTL